MKFLFVGNHQSVFIKELTSRLKRKCPDYDISLLSLNRQETLQEYYLINGINLIFQQNAWPDLFYRIPRIRGLALTLDIRKALPDGTFDICNVHYASWNMGLIAGALASCCSRFVVSVWGSDLYGTRGLWQIPQSFLFKNAAAVTATNSKTLEMVNERFALEGKWMEVVRFGLAPLDELRKNEWDKADCRRHLGISHDSLVVTIGYNNNSAQQHIDVLESLMRNRSALPQNLMLLFPMAYGGTDDYREAVRKNLESTGLKYMILDRFMSDEEVAILRRASDFMIQVQTTDQFSGSMQEYLFAENIVITGDWLPYDVIDERGGFMLRVAAVEEVGEKLEYAINNMDVLQERCKVNPGIIWELSSWEKNIDAWIGFFEKITCQDRRFSFV